MAYYLIKIYKQSCSTINCSMNGYEIQKVCCICFYTLSQFYFERNNLFLRTIKLLDHEDKNLFYFISLNVIKSVNCKFTDTLLEFYDLFRTEGSIKIICSHSLFFYQ